MIYGVPRFATSA